MGRTQIRGGQVLDGSIKRKDLNIDNADNAVIRKIIAGTGISISSTGAATGTGDVTVNATGGGSGGSNVEIAGEKLLAFSVETTDATESTLAEVEITDDTTTTFIAWIAARGPSNKNYWCQISGGVRRNTSASSVLIGTPIITDDDENSSGYVADVDVDGNNLRIRVTGAASETVIWQGKILQTNAVDEEQYLTSSGVLGFTAVTEDATETALATLKVPDNKNVSFQILVSSHLDDTATNKNYWCQILGSVRRNNGGDAVLVDDPILSQGDEGTPGYSCEVAVSGQNLVLNVTGATSETVNWRAKFIIVEDREPLNVIEVVDKVLQWSSDEQVYPFEKANDGSTLYCKEIDCGALPNAGSKNVSHNISSFDVTDMHNISGVAVGGGEAMQLTYAVPAPYGNYSVQLWVTSTTVSFQT